MLFSETFVLVVELGLKKDLLSRLYHHDLCYVFYFYSIILPRGELSVS